MNNVSYIVNCSIRMKLSVYSIRYLFIMLNVIINYTYGKLDVIACRPKMSTWLCFIYGGSGHKFIKHVPHKLLYFIYTYSVYIPKLIMYNLSLLTVALSLLLLLMHQNFISLILYVCIHI